MTEGPGTDGESRWRTYFDEKLHGDSDLVDAATWAAVRAANMGARTSADAAAVGERAAADMRGARTRSQQNRAMTYGLVTDVQRSQMMSRGTTYTTVELSLLAPRNARRQVTMRGEWMGGDIRPGDVVVVLEADIDRGTYYANRVFNESRQIEARAGVGPAGKWSWYRTQIWGRRMGFAFLGFVLVGFVAIIVVGTGLFGMIRDNSHSGPSGGSQSAETVVVPDLTGLGSNEAFDKAVRAGLRPVMQQESNHSVPFAHIFRQKPSAGERVQRDSSLYLYVAVG